MTLRSAILLALLALSPAPLLADDAADFESACRSQGTSAEICACKAGQAVQLLDDRMLGLVIISMSDEATFTRMSNDGVVTSGDMAVWTSYIRDSNKACNLNY